MQGLTLKTLKLINIFFAEGEKSIAMKLLINECGNNLPLCEKNTAIDLERIRFAVIKLSDGNLVKMRSFIDTAKTDWRDLLIIADFADESTAHDVWVNSIIGGELNVKSTKK